MDVICKWMCYVNGCAMEVCYVNGCVGAGGRDALKTRTHTPSSSGKYIKVRISRKANLIEFDNTRTYKKLFMKFDTTHFYWDPGPPWVDPWGPWALGTLGPWGLWALGTLGPWGPLGLGDP